MNSFATLETDDHTTVRSGATWKERITIMNSFATLEIGRLASEDHTTMRSAATWKERITIMNSFATLETGRKITQQ